MSKDCSQRGASVDDGDIEDALVFTYPDAENSAGLGFGTGLGLGKIVVCCIIIIALLIDISRAFRWWSASFLR